MAEPRHRIGRPPAAPPDATAPESEEEPATPVQLDGTSWKGVLRRALREYRTDHVSDWAAALTYRSILALFPALVVLVAALGLVGHSTSTKILNNIEKHAPTGARSTLRTIVTNAQQQHGAASLIGILGLLLALWSASGYVAAFMRASNAIYDIDEGRPIWKLLPIRLAITVFLVIAVIAGTGITVLSGNIAKDVGNAIGAGSTAVTAWNIAKWPLLLVIATLVLAVLYWAAPNVRQPGFAWIGPGGLLAVVIWVLASTGFGLYATHSHNSMYGSLGGIILFLIWLWITNIALLLGAEFNSELQRARAIDAGMPPDHEPYVDLRDTRKLDPAQREQAAALPEHLRHG